MTERGPEVDFLGMIDLHPALAPYPMMSEDQLQELMADLVANGQREPLIATEDARLLDGRNRYIALGRLGYTPVVETRRVGDPFAFVAQHKKAYIDGLPKFAKAVLGAELAQLPVNRDQAIREDQAAGLYITAARAAELVGLSSDNPIQVVRRILNDGIPELIELVRDSKVAPFTALRACQQLSPEEQLIYVEKVQRGADPYRAGPRLGKNGPLTGRSSDRHGVVNVPAITRFTDTLAAFTMVVESAEGLDPALTPEMAKQLYGQLSRAHLGYSRLSALLRERKEQQ